MATTNGKNGKIVTLESLQREATAAKTEWEVFWTADAKAAYKRHLAARDEIKDYFLAPTPVDPPTAATKKVEAAVKA